MTSPTQRTLAELKKRGAVAAVVEKWNPHAHIRQDLFGFIDVLALDSYGTNDTYVSAKPQTLGIQTTSGSGASRIRKIIAEERAKVWLLAGNRIEVWVWAKRGARGKRKVWTLKVTEVTLEDFE